MNRRKFLKLTSAGAVAVSTQGIFTLTGCNKQKEKKPAKEAGGFMSGPPKYTVADAHFHYVDFLQKTEGTAELIKAMNANGVEHIMFSGMPLVKNGIRMNLKLPILHGKTTPGPTGIQPRISLLPAQF